MCTDGNSSWLGVHLFNTSAIVGSTDYPSNIPQAGIYMRIGTYFWNQSLLCNMYVNGTLAYSIPDQNNAWGGNAKNVAIKMTCSTNGTFSFYSLGNSTARFTASLTQHSFPAANSYHGFSSCPGLGSTTYVNNYTIQSGVY